jgi:hypothetical protein
MLVKNNINCIKKIPLDIIQPYMIHLVWDNSTFTWSIYMVCNCIYYVNVWFWEEKKSELKSPLFDDKEMKFLSFQKLGQTNKLLSSNS